MKITILALHLGYGGIEKFISNIANMFEENNEVEIISIYRLYDTPPFYINSNVKITYLLENMKPNKNEFYECIRKFNFLGLIKQSYIALKILYLKKHKMKNAIKKIESDVIISTIKPHNLLVSKYGKKDIIKIATEHNYKVNNKKYINNIIKSCYNLNYLVIASKKLADIYSNKMINSKCKVINIPLNLDYFPQKISKLDNKVITYIGRLSEEKGVLDLIEIFKKIYDKDQEFKLNVVGDGELRNKIIQKIEENHLENNVILHGYKTRNEIEEIMLNTTIGINTSYTESFGLALIETFSYGIPCVAFSCAEGAKEIIDDNKNGYIIENRDFEKMTRMILDLVNNEAKLKNFGKNAREKSEQFSMENIQQKWFDLLY